MKWIGRRRSALFVVSGFCLVVTMLFGSPLHMARAADDTARECADYAKRMGPESSENYLVRNFITPSAHAECPVEGRRIYLRECLKPRVLVGEGGGIAQYTTRTKGW